MFIQNSNRFRAAFADDKDLLLRDLQELNTNVMELITLVTQLQIDLALLAARVTVLESAP